MSASNGGCTACVWRVRESCESDSGVSGPSGDHCLGSFVGCPPNQLRFVVYLETPSQPATEVDSYCWAAANGGVISAASTAIDARRYLDDITLSAPALSVQPRGATLTNLDTFFQAAPDLPPARSFGGQGYSLTLRAQPTDYHWDWGDGQTADTPDPGGPAPDGDVRYRFKHAGTYNIALSISYGGSYDVTTPFGTFGPNAVDTASRPFTAPVAYMRVDVRDQQAVLINNG